MRKQILFPADIRQYVTTYYIKTVLLFLGLAAAFGLVLWLFGEQLFGSLAGWQKVTIYTLVMVSTVWIARLPQRLCNRTFCGRVEKVNVATTYVDYNHKDYWEPPTENHIGLLLVTPNGRRISKRVYTGEVRRLQKTDPFQPGDRVLHLAGTGHTVRLPQPADAHVACAVCGRENDVRERACEACGHTLIKNIEL